MIVGIDRRGLPPDVRIIRVASVRCSSCGEDLSAYVFSEGLLPQYPVPCTEAMLRMPLCHSPTTGGCGGRLLLSQDITQG